LQAQDCLDNRNFELGQDLNLGYLKGRFTSIFQSTQHLNTSFEISDCYWLKSALPENYERAIAV
jgi:hypothetical protein